MRLVDTSAWVEFLRRQGDPRVKQAVARYLQADLAAYTCPTRFELLSGVKPAEKADLEQALQFSHHVPFERDDWSQAARLERRLRDRGVTIPRNDLFVATVAIRTGLTIACRDAHFDTLRKVVGGKMEVEQL